jgi:RNA polymerase sigma factor (sigma-70 family)
MTANSTDHATSHAALSALHAKTVAVAQRFLGLSICLDYLSTGQGHRQSRRVVAERLANQKRQQALPLAATSRRQSGRAPTTGLRKQLDPELRYLSEVAARPRLTSREEYSLAIRMHTGDTHAHDALIEANLGLVVMFARQYQRPGVPMLDLVAEGNFGLLTAAKRFNPELGCRFATYAKWWVMRAIQIAIPKLVGVVRLPASHFGKRDDRLAQPLPEKDERLSLVSCTAADMSPDAEHEDSLEPPSGSHATLCSSEHMDIQVTAWANDYRAETTDQDMLDTMAMPVEQEPPQAMMAVQKTQALQRALAELPDRHRIVITKRFALHHDHACTLDELAREFGVSKERIRQIENVALTKLQRILSPAGVQERG